MGRATSTSDNMELDLGRYELRRLGRRVRLEKKPMDLLIYLVSRRDQLVSRDDIVAKLWRSDLFVDTERNINNLVRKIRAALHDDAARPLYLETVVGKGYRFVGPLRVIDAQYAAAEPSPSAPRAHTLTAQANERSSLAVLPLVLLGDAADDQGLCLGFADALVSRLGNLHGLDVLPTSAVINVPGGLAASDVASRMAVRFVLHGAVQASKGQLRLSLELFDAQQQRATFNRKGDLTLDRLFELEDEIARQIAATLNRSLRPVSPAGRMRYSRDPLAYAEFMRGFKLSSSGDPKSLEQATEHLIHAVTRDAAFALAHATLSLVCATRHFELDPSHVWLEKAEFHCRRALELAPDLPEGHVANAFLLWGPSKNFQHEGAIAELRRALRLQNNLPHAYNRLGTILAHIGLLGHAREMYERGRSFDPKKAVSHSIVQVYMWSGEYDLARAEIARWRDESPSNKYPVYFAPQPAMFTGNYNEAGRLLDEAVQVLPDEPMVISLQGVFYALTGKAQPALDCLTRACAIPKSFGHAHHSYYQIACILALLDRTKAAFEWLERSVDAGFACWPLFLRDPCVQRLRALPEFEVLVSALQARYPDHLGLL